MQNNSQNFVNFLLRAATNFELNEELKNNKDDLVGFLQKDWSLDRDDAIIVNNVYTINSAEIPNATDRKKLYNRTLTAFEDLGTDGNWNVTAAINDAT